MDEKIERFNAMRSELLTVEAALANHKRDYVVDGVSCPLKTRVALDARRADLKLALHLLRPEIVALQEEAKAFKYQTFLHHLVPTVQGCWP